MIHGRAAAAALVLVVLAGCAQGSEQYAASALEAVEAAAGEVATAELALRQRADDRVTRPYADQVVTAAESAVGGTGSSFDARQPPTGADPLRDRVSQAIGGAVDAIAAGRVAVRRDDRDGIRAALAELETLSEELDALEGELR